MSIVYRGLNEMPRQKISLRELKYNKKYFNNKDEPIRFIIKKNDAKLNIKCYLNLSNFNQNLSNHLCQSFYNRYSGLGIIGNKVYTAIRKTFDSDNKQKAFSIICFYNSTIMNQLNNSFIMLKDRISEFKDFQKLFIHVRRKKIKC